MSNRQGRRRIAASQRKLSRDAAPGEILGKTDMPIRVDAKQVMASILKVCQEQFPGYDVTLFLAAKEAAPGEEFPRFNYGSTASREDMIAVLMAFIDKQAKLAGLNVEIADEPPVETPQ